MSGKHARRMRLGEALKRMAYMAEAQEPGKSRLSPLFFDAGVQCLNPKSRERADYWAAIAEAAYGTDESLVYTDELPVQHERRAG